MKDEIRVLVGKLNPECRALVEAAAGLCLARTHYNIEIEHWLLKALDRTDGDVAFLLKQYGVDRTRLSKDLQAGLDRLQRGNAKLCGAPEAGPAKASRCHKAPNFEHV